MPVCPVRFARRPLAGFRHLGLAVAGLLLGVPAGPVLAEPARPAVTDAARISETVRAQLTDLLSRVRTATFEQKTWEKNGRKEDWTEGRVWWAGTDRIRIDVDRGRGSNSTAILEGETVHGFRRGALSFVKLKFDVRADKVLSIRDHDMRQTGPVPDLAWILEHWDRATVSETGETIEIRFTDRFGTMSTIRLTGKDWSTIRHEVHENGELVERYEYDDIVWNAEFDDELLVP